MRNNALKKRYAFFLINHIYRGTRFFKRKRVLLRFAGFDIGENTKIVGPFNSSASFSAGKNCWIGRNFSAEGNGNVTVGDNVNIAPGVTLLTGTHKIGPRSERAGEGLNTKIKIEDGVWLCANSTIVGDCIVGRGSVVAACACVCNDIEPDTLSGGVPAKKIKSLSANEE